ncbi:hypothetical protein A3A49_01620 [Candidatus Curtissbacteria bacterium RIFCSPLOWO2_01_FULL_38_11b]|uniref:Lipoprotein n=1 Tax=Candidatus Curtissbacteria bacterium RIFCSPLOWO2_01_FULL_38_11b TaxID=1797725 RepID=A0A1F5H1U5_9BACT|nr:MAG: hypothetical protein A3A49_01620 [Candidatus Curtissbacteria bacterium RIFCSPLOWO2_01_FULL_38_11b]
MKHIILVVLVSLILAGCLPSIQREKGPDATGEFIKGQVVRGFPGLPLYPKSQVIETYGSIEGYGGSFVSKDKLSKVVNFYGPTLGQLGWETVLRKKSESYYVYEIKNDNFIGEVIINIASDNKQTAITVALEPR